MATFKCCECKKKFKGYPPLVDELLPTCEECKKEYRAWNIKSGARIPDGAYYIAPNGEVMVLDPNTNVFSCSPDLLLEQSTGFRDKNGNRIWEGDIIKSFDAGSNRDYVGVVEYKKSCGCYLVHFINPDMTFSLHKNDEVIGNIHENPDILR